jgi:hypothetical protein
MNDVERDPGKEESCAAAAEEEPIERCIEYGEHRKCTHGKAKPSQPQTQDEHD